MANFTIELTDLELSAVLSIRLTGGNSNRGKWNMANGSPIDSDVRMCIQKVKDSIAIAAGGGNATGANAEQAKT